jgi:predicted membrane protein
MTGKIISLIIVGICLLLTYMTAGGEHFLQMIGVLVLPLACIWFSEEWGGYSGAFPPTSGVSQIKASPPILLYIFGWIFLIVVFILLIIAAVG